LDKRAPYPAIFKNYALGSPSEHANKLWWYLLNAAQLKTQPGWSCERQSSVGQQIMFLTAGRGGGVYQGKSWTAGAQQAVVLDLRLPHKYFTADDDPWEMHYVRFEGSGVSALLTSLVASSGSPVLPYSSIPEMEAHFAALYQLSKEQPPGYDARIWHHLTGLVTLIVEGMRRGGWLSATAGLEQTAEGVARALHYLRGHHQGTVSVEDLAAQAHMSRYHFTRLFKRATALTPMDYLEKFRIGRAKEMMLSQPDLRLNEIANAVGFADPAYFSRVFRKREGMSSKAYRKWMIEQQG
jgi:AraC family transcriptional regulator of arabinose operon